MSGAVDSNGWRCSSTPSGWVYTCDMVALELGRGSRGWLAKARHLTTIQHSVPRPTLGQGATPIDAMRRALEAFAPAEAPFRNREAWEECRAAPPAMPIAGGPLDAESQEGAA